MRLTRMHPGWMAGVGVLLTSLGGCTAPSRPAPAAMGQDTAGGAPAPARHVVVAEELERRMTLGPVAARSLGWRPTWTTSFVPDGGIQRVWATAAGVLVLDGRNELSLLNTDTGLRRWRAFVADPGDRVLDMHIAEEAGLVLVLRSDAVVTLNVDTGFPTGALDGAVPPVQRLEWLARTGGVLAGSDLIYGGLGGEVVWHSWGRGFSSKAHRVGRRIGIAPAKDGPSGQTIVAASLSGQLIALQATSGSLMWSRTLLDGIGGDPVFDDKYVYVSGLDQHLRCLDVITGRPLWTALMMAPLRSGATIKGDHVYQQVPGVGLTAWEVQPKDSPDGVQLWTAPNVEGNVIATQTDRLLTWHEATGTLATISPTTGTIDTRIELPSGTRVQQAGQGDGRIFVIGDDGKLESLVPAR